MMMPPMMNAMPPVYKTKESVNLFQATTRKTKQQSNNDNKKNKSKMRIDCPFDPILRQQLVPGQSLAPFRNEM